MRPGHVKGLDAAMAAKTVFCDPGIKSISTKRVLTPKQSKRIGGDQKVQVTGLRADTAIAVVSRDRRRRVDFESYPATVAPALVRRHRLSYFTFFHMITRLLEGTR